MWQNSAFHGTMFISQSLLDSFSKWRRFCFYFFFYVCKGSLLQISVYLWEEKCCRHLKFSSQLSHLHLHLSSPPPAVEDPVRTVILVIYFNGSTDILSHQSNLGQRRMNFSLFHLNLLWLTMAILLVLK